MTTRAPGRPRSIDLDDRVLTLEETAQTLGMKASSLYDLNRTKSRWPASARAEHLLVMRRPLGHGHVRPRWGWLKSEALFAFQQSNAPGTVCTCATCKAQRAPRRARRAS